MMRRSILVLTAVLALAAYAAAQETLPPNAKVVRLESQPPAIQLKNPFEYSQLIVIGVLDTGDRVDVTRMAKLDAPGVVTVSPTGLVRPAADGAAELKISLAGQAVAVPVKVTGQK